MKKIKRSQRLTQKQKNANKKQWYIENINLLDIHHYDSDLGYGGVSEQKRMKVNYELFNNILDLADFEYVCTPYGSEVGELPAKMTNRDIVSGKIKAILGMEMKRSLPWKPVAINPEATSRREKEEMDRIKQYVIDYIMQPIREQAEIESQQQIKGNELTQQEIAQIKQQVEQTVQSQTPDEVKRYMERDYQDPIEVMSQQLTEYLIKAKDIKRKFIKAYKHGLISGKEVLYVGIFNGEPDVWNVNPMRFCYDNSYDNELIEDGEFASCEYRLYPSQIVSLFGDELTDQEIDNIYETWSGFGMSESDDLFIRYENRLDYDSNNTIKVLHTTWKSLRKIGFLSYLDESGQVQEIIVDENYKIDRTNGDIKIEWEWIPEVYEGWKIKSGEPIYLRMRPISGQFKDINNLHHCKLPYHGIVYDNMNSEVTSLMDRIKAYQYYFNLLWYRFELLLASDKGKKVLMNINVVPDSMGIDMKTWAYYLDTMGIMWYNPNEEGTGHMDAGSIAKEIDLTFTGQLNEYINMMEYVRQQCGRSVGILDNVEGQIDNNAAVKNTQQSLINTSNILEPYFEVHDQVKKNVLQALLETAKVAYSNKESVKTSYALDDLSIAILNVDIGKLDSETVGIFIGDSSESNEARETIKSLSHAAMQNQKIELSDAITLVRTKSLAVAEETLKVAEQNRRDHELQIQEQQRQTQAEQGERELQAKREEHEMEKELVILKAEEDRKTELLKGAMIGMSYNPDADSDGDGENDFFEIAKHGLEAEIKRSQQQLEREKFEHQKKVDQKKLDNEAQKIQNDKAKINSSKNKS